MAEQLETILAWLDAVRTDLDAATDGPWRAALLDGVECEDGSSSYRGGIYPARIGAPPIILTNGVDRRNARLIASVSDRLDRMERALRNMLGSHNALWGCGNPRHTNPSVGCPECEVVCAACGERYPCPTAVTIEEALK